MRLLTPLTVVAAMCSLSGDLAFAQAPGIGGVLSDGEHATITATATVTAGDAPIEGVMSAPRAHAADAMAPVVVFPTTERLRPVGSGLATVVAQATARSATFRQLVQAIGETDGIVYVEHGRCGHGVRACLLAVNAAGANRIVRVRVGAHTADWDLMGSIGHELQHAVEVLSHSAITSTAAMLAFYQREGRRINDLVETAAAVRVGNLVRAEARRTNFSRQAR